MLHQIFKFFIFLRTFEAQRVLFTETYQGSCSTQYSDDMMFTYEELGDQNQMTYSTTLGLAFWMKFSTSNNDAIYWPFTSTNYVFLMSDQPGNTLETQIFSMFMGRTEPTQQQMNLVTRKDGRSGLGPTLTYNLETGDVGRIHDNWIFVWAGINFNNIGFALKVYQASENTPFIYQEQYCPDGSKMSNCAGGTVSRPFLRRPQLQLWVGGRGAHKEDETLKNSFCGQISHFQIYPGVFQLDTKNLQFYKYGMVQSNLISIYRASAQQELNKEVNDFGQQHKNGQITLAGGDLKYYNSNLKAWELDVLSFIEFPTLHLLQFINPILSETNYYTNDWGYLSLSYWIYLDEYILDYTSWRFRSKNPLIGDIISIQHEVMEYSNDESQGYFSIILKSGYTICPSSNIIYMNTWTKVLIMLYHQPHSATPFHTHMNVITYYLGISGVTTSDMAIICPTQNELFGNEDVKIQLGGIGHKLDDGYKIQISEAVIIQSGRILFHDTYKYAPKDCSISVEMKNSIYCWLCSPGYFMELGVSGQACLPQIADLQQSVLQQSFDPMDARGSMFDCALPCKTCNITVPGNRTKCLSCVENQILQEDGSCGCPDGTFITDPLMRCPRIIPSNTVKVGTYFSFNQLSQINENFGIRSFEIDIVFDSPFLQIPNIALGLIYIEASGLQFSFDAKSITNIKFTLIVQVKAITQINDFGIKYLAYISPPDYIETGLQYTPYDSDIGKGSGDRSFMQQVDFQTYDNRTGIPKVLAFITALEMNLEATNASISYQIINTNVNQFFLKTLVSGDGLYVKVAWNWIAFSPIFESILAEFDSTEIQFSLAQTPQSQNPFRYNQTEISFINKLHGNTQLMFGLSQFNCVVSQGLYISTELFRYSMDDLTLTNKVRAINGAVIGKVTTSVISFQADCQAFECKQCKLNPMDCVSCLNDSKDPLTQCFDCRSDYYLDALEQCQPCDFFCLTCSGSPGNCNKCDSINANRVDNTVEQCPCSQRYFDSGVSVCSQCSNKCQNCAVTADACDACAGDNRNFDCSCPTKFYDDLVSQNCIECKEPCDDCNLGGCLSCLANRELVGVECECPSSGSPIAGTSYCNSCFDVILDIQIDDKYLNIAIKFSQSITFVDQTFVSLTPFELCGQLFPTSTMSLFGTGPQCQINSPFLNISIGSNPTIMNNDPIYIKLNTLRGPNCFNPLSNFIGNLLKFPIILPYPFVIKYFLFYKKLNVTYPLQAITLCDEVNIELINFLYDGRRPWLTYFWSIASPIEDAALGIFIKNLVDAANLVDSNKIVIPSNTLKKYMTLNLALTAKSFLDLETTSSIDIQTYEYSSPQITLKEGNFIQVTLKQPIMITSYFSVKICDPQTFKITISQPPLKLIFYEQVYDRVPSNARPILKDPFEIEVLEQQKDQSFNIPQMTGDSNTLYKIIAQITYENIGQTMNAQTQIMISIVDIPLVAYILGGNRQVNQGIPQQINGRAWDPNTIQAYNTDPELLIKWECTNLVTGGECMSTYSEIIELPTNLYVVNIAQNVLFPYNTYNFTIVAVKGLRKTSSSALIQVIDFQVEELLVDFAGGILKRPISLNEIIEFSINLPSLTGPNQVEMNMQILYQDKLIYQNPISYSKLQLRIWDFVQEVVEDATFDISIICIIKERSEFPFEFRQVLIINAPPVNGVVSVSPKTGVAMETLFTVQVDRVEDLNMPFTYWFMVYLNRTMYDADMIDGSSTNAFDLSEVKSENLLLTYLPFGDLILVVQVTDAQGGISNFTLEFTVSQPITTIEQLQNITTSHLGQVVCMVVVAQMFDQMDKTQKILQNTVIVEFIQQMLSIAKRFSTTSSSLKNAFRRSLFFLQAQNPEYFSFITITEKINYLSEAMNQIRQKVVEFMAEILSQKRQLRLAQELGDSKKYIDYSRVNALVVAQAVILDSLMDVFDADIGRNLTDRPFNKTEMDIFFPPQDELFSFIDSNSTSAEAARLLVDESVVAVDESAGLSPELAELSDRNRSNILVHTVYQRSLSLIHIIAQTMQMRLLTNDPPQKWVGSFISLQYSRCTQDKLNRYLTIDDDMPSLNNGDIYNYVNMTDPNNVWYNYEDAELLGSSTIYGYTSVINETNGDESSGQSDISINKNLDLIVWEDRDNYAKLPLNIPIDVLKTYFFSVAHMNVNPYYWYPSIYNYTNHTSYYRNQSFYSPMFKVIGFQLQKRIQLSNGYSIAFNFDINPKYNISEYKCVQIVSNWTDDNCTLVPIGDNQVTCRCTYLADISLIQHYNPEIIIIPKITVHLNDIMNYLLGQVMMFKTLSFGLFMIIGLLLDSRSSRTIPIADEDADKEAEKEQGKDKESPEEANDTDLDVSDENVRTDKPKKQQKDDEEQQNNLDVTEISFMNNKSIAMGMSSDSFAPVKRDKKRESRVKQSKEQANNRMLLIMEKMGKVIEEQREKQMFDASTVYDSQIKGNGDLGLKNFSTSMLLKGFLFLHELFSIFIYYDAQTSRFVRFLTLYIKLVVMLCISSYLHEMDKFSFISLTILGGEVSVFFIKVMKAELSGGFFSKLIGIIIMGAVLFLAWLITMSRVDGIDIEVADDWANSFIIAYLINTFLVDLGMVAMKLQIFPWATQQMMGQDTSPLVFLMFFLINCADINEFYKI